MPGGSEVCRDLSRIRRSSRQRTYHDSNFFGSFRYMCGSQMPQPPLDPIARDCIAKSTADHEADACSIVAVGRMNHQRGSTHTDPSSGGLLKILGATHSQRSRQHASGSTNAQADRRLRPLRRRAEIIARPARVRIRRRKPWVRLRRRLLGWKVRLLTGKLPHLRSAR